jgi:general secretion pathway protein D
MKTMMKNKMNECILLVLALVICSCATDQTFPKPVTLDRIPPTQTAADVNAQAAKSAPAYEALKPPIFPKTTAEKKLPPREPIDAKRFNLANIPVMINVEKMPISDFIIHALGATLKIAFVMDEATMNNKQPVTMIMPQTVPPEIAFGMVLGLLEKNGLYVEEGAGSLYILQKPPEAKSLFDIRIGRSAVDSQADILQIIPMKHIRVGEIDWLIRDIVKSGIQLKPYPKENILLLYGRANQMKQIIDLIDTFDIPNLQGKNIFLVRLDYWQIDDFIKEISKILTGMGFTIALNQRDPGPLFIPIKTLNSILVISPDDITSKYIMDWKARLDTPEAAGTAEASYTYIPQYTKASELVSSIQKLYGVSGAASMATSVAGQSAAAAPKATSVAGQSASAAAASSAPSQGVVLADMKIAADDNRNIVMIMALPDKYKNILSLLKALDAPVKQVLIEATIVELTLTDELKYGVEWFIKNSQSGGQYTLGTLGKLGASSLGLTYTFVSDIGNFQALVTAMANTNRANILSTPRLTVMDNKEATIQVGQDVPTVTGQLSTLNSTTTTSTANTNILSTISYRSTGVLLKVKPTINTEGLLTLDIAQEVSLPGADGAGGSPIFLTRKITTYVVVAHGQTLALGGLMSENASTAETKVPILGDIPLIGNLFKYTAKTKDKTELLVLVTPTILTNTDDAVKITGELKKQLHWISQ